MGLIMVTTRASLWRPVMSARLNQITHDFSPPPPVCTTELGTVAKMLPEFAKRNTKVSSLSGDPVDRHHQWE